MAIASFKPNSDFTPVPKLPEAQSSNYKGLTYDNNQTPVVSLTAYVAGAPWTVTYYAQVLGSHNDLKPLDSNLAAEYQSYTKILDLEIRVQSDLSSQTDTTSQLTTTTGSATVYSFMEPNINDYFIAETGHQRAALFIITSVDRETWRRESVHTIQYRMVDYVYRLEQDIASLDLKTTTEYVFSKDRLLEGLTPYLKTEQYQELVDLRQARIQIGNYYLDTFISQSSNTLLIPGQVADRIYDPFLVDFVLSTFGYLDFHKCLKIKQYPKSGDIYLEQPQFWDAILKRDRNLINFGNQTMMVATTSQFPRTSYIKTMFSARTDKVVYPYRPDISAKTGEDPEPLVPFRACLRPTTGANGRDPTDEEITYFMGEKAIPAYPLAHVSGYYILSKAFYEERSELTLLEILTRDYLAGRTLDLKQLTFLYKLYPKMPRLEQFYFGPLIMTLMGYSDRNMY